MFQRILTPVDLTAKSLTAVELAGRLAAQSDAEVILLHVIETIDHVEFAELKQFYERLETSARNGLQEFAERLVSDNVRVGHVLLYGHRTQKIVEYAM